MTESIATLMTPSEQAVNRLEHCKAFATIVAQTQICEDLWEIDVEAIAFGDTPAQKIYFDKPIEYDGRREGLFICVRYADRCELTFEDEAEIQREAYYFFILDVVIVEEGTNASFQAEHFKH